MIDKHVIDTNGNFDARKARQLLYEFTRDNSVVSRSYNLATHLGLNSEDSALLMAIALLQENIGLSRLLEEDIATRIPTFRVQATQSGPFDTKEGKR